MSLNSKYEMTLEKQVSYSGVEGHCSVFNGAVCHLSCVNVNGSFKRLNDEPVPAKKVISTIFLWFWMFIMKRTGAQEALDDAA